MRSVCPVGGQVMDFRLFVHHAGMCRAVYTALGGPAQCGKGVQSAILIPSNFTLPTWCGVPV